MNLLIGQVMQVRVIIPHLLQLKEVDVSREF
jgi:hypothetical protein